MDGVPPQACSEGGPSSSSSCCLQRDRQRQGRTQPGGNADWGVRPAENQAQQPAL